MAWTTFRPGGCLASGLGPATVANIRAVNPLEKHPLSVHYAPETAVRNASVVSVNPGSATDGVWQSLKSRGIRHMHQGPLRKATSVV